MSLLLNKKILLALGMIVFVGAVVASGTGAFFSDTATATGNTFTAGTLDLKIAKNSSSDTPTGGWLEDQPLSWNFSDMAPGGTPSVSSVWLRNVGSVDGMKIGISATNTPTVSDYDEQVRITSLAFDGQNLLEGGAGASIGDYQEPTGCTVTVSGSGLLAAVTGATDGEIICVDTGSYGTATYPITADNVTLVGLHDPRGSDAASITGSIDVTGDGVTVRGLKVTNPSASYGMIIDSAKDVTVADNYIYGIGTALSLGSAQGVYVRNGSGAAMSDIAISGNVIEDIGNTGLIHGGGAGSSAKGVYIGTTSGIGSMDAVTVENNLIFGIEAAIVPWVFGGGGGAGAYGIMTNYAPGVTNFVVKNNTIYDLDGLWATAIGLEGLTTGASVTYNDIRDLVNHKTVDDSNGVKIEGNTGTGIVIQYNNFAPNVAYGVTHATAAGATVNAKFNWWGDWDPSDDALSAGPFINTADFAGGPVAGLVGGIDQNGNGYADLDDLAVTTIVGAEPGLDADEYKRLVMGVQIDGPSTGNSFQGATLTTDLTFTLSQQ